MDKNSAKQLLFDKKSYYEDTTRKIRWMAILLVLLSYPLSSQHGKLIGGLIIAAGLYNCLWYWKWLSKKNFFGSYISMNILDNVFATFLVAMSGGIRSPYYVLFILMSMTVTYWYGYKGLVTLGLFHVATAAGMIMLVRTPPLPSDPIHLASVFLFTIIINGILVERLTRGDRQERQTAVAANREIETERQRLLALLNSIGDSVIAIDRMGQTLLYNGAALELLNTNAQLTGQAIGDYLKLFDEEEKPVSIDQLFMASSGIIRRQDLSCKVSDNSLVRLDLTVSPITSIGKSRDLEGGFIIIMKDITKQKTLEETRDEFVAVTSHELRTPIAVAEGNLSVALTTVDPADQKTKERLTKAHNSVLFLGKLIEDLSTLARADRGILDVDLAMVDPAELANQLKENYQSEAEAKGINITTKFGPDLHPILTSASHIYEVLQNFVSNAIKYTEKGEIELLADASKDNKGSIVFCVKDTGIGISVSDQKKVFEKFFRSEDYRTRTTGGTGLGLYIARKLAERLSGKIWFDSELDKGSTFCLEVPPASIRKEDQSKVATAQVDDFVSTI